MYQNKYIKPIAILILALAILAWVLNTII